MIDYLAESRLVATAKVSGNLGRVLGVALSFFHREQTEKILRLEASNEPDAEISVAILKAELAIFERWHRDLEKLLARQRQEQNEDSAHG